MTITGEGSLLQFRRSRMAGLAGIALLAIALQFPVSMIRGLTFERAERRDAAAAEVGAKWGRSQALTGPLLAVPYTHRWLEQSDEGRTVEKTATRTAFVLPDRLHVEGTLSVDPGLQSEDAVRGGVLGTDVEGHVLGLQLHRDRRFGQVAEQILV